MRGMIDFIEPFEARDRTTGELLSLIVEKHVGNVPPPPDLTRMTTKEMAKCLGIDGKGAQKIQAALELSSRSRPLTRSLPLRNVEDVVLYFRERLGDHRKESFWALTLDREHHPIDCHRISEGTLSTTPVHPREAFIPALRDSAAAVIFVHNHPSGDPAPGWIDRDLTDRLLECGDLLGIRVRDHLIVASEGHYSFDAHGGMRSEYGSRTLLETHSLRNGEDVASYFRERLGDYRKESFWALTLNQKHRLLDCHRITEGMLSTTPVPPQKAFLPALRDSAAAVIFVHNHPSGAPAPSIDDRDLALRLSECGDLLGIRVLDHLVVGSEGHYSFRDHGAIENEGESRAAEAGRQKPAVSTRNEPGRTGGEGGDRRPEPPASAAMEKPPQQIRDRFRDDGRGR